MSYSAYSGFNNHNAYNDTVSTNAYRSNTYGETETRGFYDRIIDKHDLSEPMHLWSFDIQDLEEYRNKVIKDETLTNTATYSPELKNSLIKKLEERITRVPDKFEKKFFDDLINHRNKYSSFSMQQELYEKYFGKQDFNSVFAKRMEDEINNIRQKINNIQKGIQTLQMERQNNL